MPAYDQIGQKIPTFAKTRQLKINKLVTGTLSHQELYDWQHKVPPMASDPKKGPFHGGKNSNCEY